jgi:hypothetical protein
MDKPPTKTKPSAFDAEAKALDDRLRELISDYAALFLRYPNVEGRPSVEVLEKMQVLAAIRVHPWRKKLAAIAASEINAAFGESHGWLRRMWIEGIAFHVERRCAAAEREAIARDDAIVREAIARDVIATMPADLRTRCPGYPSLYDPDAIQTAAVAVSLKIKTELNLGIHGGDLDAIKIGRLTLTALGYEGRADDLLPTEQRKKKRRERYRKKSSI